MNVIQKAFYKIRHFFSGLTFSKNRREYSKNYKYFQSNSIYLTNIINKISNDVAMLKFKQVKVNHKVNEFDNVEQIVNSDLLEVISVSPNDYQTPFAFWFDVTKTLLREEVCVVVPIYKKGRLVEITKAETFERIENHKAIIHVDGIKKEIDIGSVWIFENPKESVSSSINNIINLIDDNLNSLSLKISQKSNDLKGFLKIPTRADDDTLKKEAEDRISQILETANIGGIGYLQKGEEFQELSNTYSTASPQEVEFLKNQLYHAYGINEKLLTCDYSESQYKAYFNSVLKMFQRIFAEEINRKHFTKTARTQGNKLLIYFDLFDISSLKDLSEFFGTTVYQGIVNKNEARSILGYAGYPGGDIFETNANAVPVVERVNLIEENS